ncbi:exosortase family protein XrtG [Ligilactobacillus apodemi]|uniref:exosortase family protein XrtG n=1 Tax=Ligilactobacillus apodemi TaxID=307126 RepID=UPI00214AC8DD|nr:exosortase family protein XrtG [Ligilactobacillus apodemi]MCR1901724.1 exosortase family protein XrtG [Ligilactobacillus apodemi]
MIYTTIFWGCVILWLYLLSVLKRAALAGYYFIFGSVGLFSALVFLGQNYLVWLFSATLTKCVNVIGELTGTFNAIQANLLQIIRSHETLYLWVDFECSGIIETTAFIGLIAFYPLYTRQERLLLAFAGSLFIFCANLLRLSLIAIALYHFGSPSFYLWHSLIGRIVFYLLVLILYYNVFTRSHIVQKFLHDKGEKI